MGKTLSRRGFLRMGTQMLASSSLLATLGTMERALAASDTSGYRALVCIFLFGGNDSFNWLVPRDAAGYAAYRAARGTLALDSGALLPITPTNIGGGPLFGLHPDSAGVQTLFESGAAAFVANLGPLVVPVSRTQFRNESVPLPPYLFSHSDQQAQWMTAYPQSREPYGWAGRVADLLKSQAYNPRLAVNISLSGNNIWQGGRETVQYALDAAGALEFDVVASPGARPGVFRDLLAQARADSPLFAREFADTQGRAVDLAQFINAGLAGSPALTTAFPGNPLGARLRMIARMVQARAAIGVSRQLFFVGVGGWDTHDRQMVDHGNLMTALGGGLLAFQQALVEIGAQNLVTTFTASDFGRTLTSNGDGSDHGWGGHALVTGGAVAGRRIYGTMPSLALEGPDDAGDGRIIPTLSTDQYAATLARWFGVADSDLDLVFPNLGNFASRDLGFLA